MDTIDQRKTDEWTARLEEALEGRTPDYLIVQHMEPDHAANIGWFAEKYPEATIVASAKAIQMMPQFFEEVNFAGRSANRQGGRHAPSGTTYPEIYHGADGTLAGSDADV